MNDIHDIICTAGQGSIEWHNSAGSAIGAASPDGHTTSSTSTETVEETHLHRFRLWMCHQTRIRYKEPQRGWMTEVPMLMSLRWLLRTGLFICGFSE